MLPFRRLLALVAVFLTAFVAVSAMRTYREGGSFRDWIPGLPKTDGRFRPEKFTLPDKAPLDLGDVELLSRLNDEYANLTKAVVPSVVSINTAGIRTERLLDFWGRTQVRSYPTQGQGSGVIVTKEGHVVTNHHVIAGQQKIQVTLHDGKIYPAHLIGEDTLARHRGAQDRRRTARSRRSRSAIPREAQVGQMVFAVGNPFGLGETVTQGIISAKERSLSDNQRDLFQTDAAINPGNSGGPLVNLRGEIIGINVAIFSPDKENPGFQGVGFSIPANDVKDALSRSSNAAGRSAASSASRCAISIPPSARHSTTTARTAPRCSGVSPGSPAEGGRAAAVGRHRFVQWRDHPLVHAALHARPGSAASARSPSSESGATGKRSNSRQPSPRAASPPRPPSSRRTLQGRTRDPEEILQALGIEVRDLSVPERMRGFRGVVVTVARRERPRRRQNLKPGDLIVCRERHADHHAPASFSCISPPPPPCRTPHLQVVRDGKSAPRHPAGAAAQGVIRIAVKFPRLSARFISMHHAPLQASLFLPRSCRRARRRRARAADPPFAAKNAAAVPTGPPACGNPSPLPKIDRPR